MTQENNTRSWFLRFDPGRRPLGRRVVRIWSREAQGGDVRQGQVRDGVREEGTLSKGTGVRLMLAFPVFRASRKGCKSITVDQREQMCLQGMLTITLQVDAIC